MSDERYFRVVGQNVDKKGVVQHEFNVGEITISTDLNGLENILCLESLNKDDCFWVETQVLQEVFKPKYEKFVELNNDNPGFKKIIPGFVYEVLFEDDGEWGYIYQVKEPVTGKIINCKVSKNRFKDVSINKKPKSECVGVIEKTENHVPGSALEKQVSGTHYKGCKIQPIEYIHANNLDYFQGNVVKYVTRHKDKNGAADIKKAIHYLELILELQYSENSSR